MDISCNVIRHRQLMTYLPHVLRAVIRHCTANDEVVQVASCNDMTVSNVMTIVINRTLDKLHLICLWQGAPPRQSLRHEDHSLHCSHLQTHTVILAVLSVNDTLC